VRETKSVAVQELSDLYRSFIVARRHLDRVEGARNVYQILTEILLESGRLQGLELDETVTLKSVLEKLAQDRVEWGALTAVLYLRVVLHSIR